jgi:hypothetical protein
MEDKKKALKFGKGLYVTRAQLGVFFGNGSMLKDRDFNLYCTNCACYNLLSDFMEQYPNEIKYYWSDKESTFAFSFSRNSEISAYLISAGVLEELEEDICEILF